MAVGDALVATLTVLRRPTMRRALLAFLAFAVAEWAVWIALLVWAFDRAGTSGASLISVVQLLPAVVVAPFGSVLGDRISRGRALALGYATQAVTMLGTAVLLVTDQPFWVVAVGGALVTCAVTLTRPVHNAVLPSLAETPAELIAGNAASTAAEGLGAFIGPLVSGLVIVAGGAEAVFALLGAVMLGAAALVAGLSVPATSEAPSAAAGAEEKNPTRSALAGVRELGRQPAAAALVGMVTLQFVVVGAMDILVIVVALEVLGTDVGGPGLLGSALGVGGVLGAVATVALVGRRRLSPALALGLLVSGVPLALLPFGAVPAVAALFLAVSGAGRSFFDVAGRTLLQRAVPDRVLSRVFGVQESMMSAALAVGAALATPAVALLGRSGALVAVGLLGPTAGALSWRRLRRLDADAVQPGPHLRLLHSVPALRLASPLVLEALSREAGELSRLDGELIVREGELGDSFYVLADGEVEVSRGGGVVRRLGAGQSFGEIALLRDVPRTATVRAVGPVLLVTLSRESFLRAVGASGPSRAAADAVAQRYLDEDEGEGPPAGLGS